MSKNPVAGLCPFNFTSQQLEQSLERILIAFFFQLFFVHFELLLFFSKRWSNGPQSGGCNLLNVNTLGGEWMKYTRPDSRTWEFRKVLDFDTGWERGKAIWLLQHAAGQSFSRSIPFLIYITRHDAHFSTCTRVRCSDVMYSVNQACPFRHDVIWSIFIWYYSWWSNRLSRGQFRSLFLIITLHFLWFKFTRVLFMRGSKLRIRVGIKTP